MAAPNRDTTRAQTYSRRGDPQTVLECKSDVRLDKLRKEEVLVKVKAAALNPVDWKIMMLIPSLFVRQNTVAGADYSGTVVASTSTRFAAGDEVYGMVAPGPFKAIRGLGSIAELAIGPTDLCAKRPEHVNPVDAAGLTLVGCTAVTLVEEVIHLRNKKDEESPRVLVCGGSSSVGLMVIPMLKHNGFRVSATCSRGKMDIVKARGAEEMFDYRDPNFKRALIDSANKDPQGPFAAVVDCVDSYDTWSVSNQIMPVHGKGVYTSVGYDFSDGIVSATRRVIAYQFLPTWLGGVPTRFTRPKMFTKRRLMDELSTYVDQGIVTPVTDSRFPFDESKAAFRRIQTNRATGKVLIEL